MRLERLFDAVDVLRIAGDPATDVTDVTYTSASARPGSLFCCVRGTRADGHDHAPEAVSRGAVALLVERPLQLPGARAEVHVSDARVAMAHAAAAFHGHPSRTLDVVGVTGTNGKSTTTTLVAAILDAAGRAAGVVGTMNSARTTPEAPELQARLAAFVADGMSAAAIEVSSVGLAQHRVDGMRFAVAVFTNLSVDELGFHGSMEDYFAAKARLFERGRAGVGVVNADDEWGRRLLASAGVPVRPYSLGDATDLDLSVGGASFRWRGHPVRLRLDAAYNVSNALAAATACAELGVPPAVVAEALSAVEPLPGHGEEVALGQPFSVVVDFAHTAGALVAVLGAARGRTAPGGRVIVVFGCGGDRDPGRRGPMGDAAGRGADVVVVTSDNPRTEDPLAIAHAVVEGAQPHARDLRLVVDRRAAIAAALREARPGDTVVIAGKGDEAGQTVGHEVLPFDDRVVAREILAELGWGPGS